MTTLALDLTQGLTVDGLVERYGVAKVKRTRAVYAGYSAESVCHAAAGWRRRLEADPSDELCAAIVFLLELDAASRD
jgi:hypothetical protein